MQVAARHWVVRGQVQGVGFRWFIHAHASSIGVRGWIRNQDDGTVAAYAVGTKEQLDTLAGLLYQGPRRAEVRGVDEHEAPVQNLGSFRVE